MAGLVSVKSRLTWRKPICTRVFKVTPEVSEDRFSAFLGCPIIHHRKVLGVLTIQQGESRVFSEDEESFLVTLGVQLASVLVNAEMRQVASQNSKQQKSTGQLQGLPGAPGIAIGEGFVLEPSSDFDAISLKRSMIRKRAVALLQSRQNHQSRI